LSFPEDDGLSREHLKFEWTDDGWMVEDLGSKNGTLVNGKPVTGKHVLEPGDRVSASCVTITFITSSSS
jgi:pSer/pThr/pTyr-binding forkhead associated (FHA) protein